MTLERMILFGQEEIFCGSDSGVCFVGYCDFACLLYTSIVYFHEAGKKRERTFWFVLFYLLIFCLFGSQSRTGTLAVLVSFCIGGVKYRNKVCQYKKTILCVLVSVLAILFFCNWYITGDIFGKWQQVRFSTKGSKKSVSYTHLVEASLLSHEICVKRDLMYLPACRK